jgi:hypothetical protein
MPIWPGAGSASLIPPEEVVPALDLGRLLEVRDVDVDRVEVPDHMLDGPVLAAGVHALEHDQDRAPAVGVDSRLAVEQVRT